MKTLKYLIYLYLTSQLSENRLAKALLQRKTHLQRQLLVGITKKNLHKMPICLSLISSIYFDHTNLQELTMRLSRFKQTKSVGPVIDMNSLEEYRAPDNKCYRRYRSGKKRN